MLRYAVLGAVTCLAATAAFADPQTAAMLRDKALHDSTAYDVLESRYFDYHHSADDTLAIVDPAQLDQNVAAWAVTLYTLANSDVDFRHLPPAKPFAFP